MAPPNAGAPTRRTWDTKEYEQKAKDRAQEARERAKENEERQKKGLKPLRRRVELPKATQDLQARDKDLELRKNEGKTLMVDSVPGGRKGPGFYCETCNRTFKDSIAYLDHVNGRFHLRKLGQTTQVSRSTLEQVRERLEYWREEFAQRAATGNPSGKREYDFEARLAELAKQQRAEKEMQRAKRKEERAARKREPPEDGPGGRPAMGLDEEAMAMMGFSSFGSSKKR